MNHPTVNLLGPGEEGMVSIDEMIAPLIKEMWSAGIRTIESCQDVGRNKDGDHCAGVWFPDVDEVRKLYLIILGDRFDPCYFDLPFETRMGGFRRLSIDDKVTMIFSTSVLIPHNDLDEVFSYLFHHNL